MKNLKFLSVLFLFALFFNVSCDEIKQTTSDNVLIKGDKGEKGDTGAQGPQGEKGDKGDTGLTGQNGINGIGQIGPKGDTGATGENGSDGIQETKIIVANTSGKNVYKVITNNNGCDGSGPSGPAGKTLEIYEDINSNGIADRDSDFLLQKFSFCYGDSMGKAFKQYMQISQYLDIRFENSEPVYNEDLDESTYEVEIYIQDDLIWDFTAKKKVKA
tara:strand:+ start:26909 stop:27556 length:648 start_codon:yes stop_codon:yes gene_type:complete